MIQNAKFDPSLVINLPRPLQPKFCGGKNPRTMPTRSPAKSVRRSGWRAMGGIVKIAAYHATYFTLNRNPASLWR